MKEEKARNGITIQCLENAVINENGWKFRLLEILLEKKDDLTEIIFFFSEEL